jgi:hypothetical protein
VLLKNSRLLGLPDGDRRRRERFIAVSKKRKRNEKNKPPWQAGQSTRQDGKEALREPSKPSLALSAIAHTAQIAKEYFEHHLKAALIAGVVLFLVVVAFLVLRKPSDCLDLETHFVGRIRVGCSLAEPPASEILADGVSGNRYTDRKAGFTLRLEEPSNWSVVQAQNIVDVNGRAAKAFQFPRGVLGNKDVTLLTNDGVVAFIHSKLLNEGKANFWVYYIPNQTRPVEEFVAAETKNLLRTGSTLVALITPLALSDSRSPWQHRATPEGIGHVELAKIEVSPDHRHALLLWKSPYFGISADIVARVIVGERDTYYTVAVRVAPAGPVEEKINHELRTMIESFRPLQFEKARSGGS